MLVRAVAFLVLARVPFGWLARLVCGFVGAHFALIVSYVTKKETLGEV